MKILFFTLLFCISSQAAVQVGFENTLHGQGTVTINIKNRSYLMVGFENIYLGPIFYYDRPYSDFSEIIYGAGIRFGDKFTVGLDAGVLDRTVFGLKGKGFAGAVILGYILSEHWHISLPILYREIDSNGDLSPRFEASFLPYIGWHFGG